MSSKINGVDGGTGAIGSGRPVARVRDATTRAKSEGSSSGDVRITGSARKLVDLEQAVQNMPAVDEARVAAISSALEEGTYKIAPEHIADQLLQMEQSLRSLTTKEKK